jgi:hypothetical protein
MRINEVVNPHDTGAFSGLRNLGRSALNQFTRSQLGVDAYGDEEAAEFEKSAVEKQKKAQQQADTQRQQTAARDAAQAISQASVPTAPAAPQTAAANIQTIAPAVQPAPAQTAPAPNFAQTNRVQYQPATVNAPTATVPNMPATVPPKPAVAAAPKVNPAAAPVVYQFDGRALNPQNPRDAGIIKQLQAAGVTSGRTSTPAQAAKARAQKQDAIQNLRRTAVRTGDRDYLRQLNKLAGLPLDSTVGI